MTTPTKIPTITSLDQLDLDKHYTYADYLTWQFKERVELIKGRIFKMSPAPNLRHQRISRDLSYLMEDYLRSHKCELLTAPFDVRLKVEEKDTVLQPDIFVVCDANKLDEQSCNGAPDLVVEILSPGNSKREMKNKFSLYESAGVKEYWVVDPVREFILVFVADDTGRFVGKQPFYAGDKVPSEVIDGFVLEAAEVLNELEDN